MRLAHGDGRSADGHLAVENHRDLKCGITAFIDGLIAFSVDEHIFIIAAAPDDGRHCFPVGDRHLCRTFDGSFSAAAAERYITQPAAVGNGSHFFQRSDVDRVADADLVVIPFALFPDQCQVKIFIKAGDGNIEGMDLILKTVAVGDRFYGWIQKLCAIFLRVICQTREKMQVIF